MKKRNIFLICAAVCAAVYVTAVLLGAATIGMVGKSRLVLSCHTARVDREMYAYWEAQQRNNYLNTHLMPSGETGGKDTELFWRWDADPNDGLERTHEEVIQDYIKTYVSAIAVSAYLFDSEGYTLTDDQREAVEGSIEDIVTHRFGGSKRAYNEQAKIYGFDLEAAKRAELLVMKQTTLINDVTADLIQCEAYYKAEYVRVKVVCVIKGTAEYETSCERLRMDLADTDSEETLEAGEDAFSAAVDSSFNADPDMRNQGNGYYFGPDETYTEDFYKTLPDVVNKAFEIENVGEWAEVDVEDVAIKDVGEGLSCTYFIRRYPLEKLLYADNSEENADRAIFFENFIQNASLNFYGEWNRTHIKDVQFVKEKVIPWVPQGSGAELYKLFLS